MSLVLYSRRSTDRLTAAAPLACRSCFPPTRGALAALALAGSALFPLLAVDAHAGPASATPLLFPMLATVCHLEDGGAPACGREIIIGGEPGSPACTINPGDCIQDTNAQFFPFAYGANRDGGVHASDVRDLSDRAAACLGGDTAVCDALPYLAIDDLVMSKNKISRLAALRDGTFKAFLDARLFASNPVLLQIPVIDEEDCIKPATGLEPDRLIVGVVTLDIRELQVLGRRRDRFLRAVLTCGVTTGEPGDGIIDFGTDGAP